MACCSACWAGLVVSSLSHAGAPSLGAVMLSKETSCHRLRRNALMASRTVMAMAQVVNRLRPWN